MSSKEMCINLIDNVPEYKIGYVLAYLQGLIVDEEADDAFYESLPERALKFRRVNPPRRVAEAK